MTSYVFLLLKQYLRSPYTYLAIFFPFFFIILLGHIIPVGLILSSSITISIILIVAFLFLGTMQELRITSMSKSLSLTKISKPILFVSTILVSLFLIIIEMFLLMVFTFLLDKVNYLTSDFSNIFPNSNNIIFNFLNYSISWSDISWINVLYGIILGTTLTFAISIFLISLIKNSKYIYIFTTIYLFVLIIAGGILLPMVFMDLVGEMRIVKNIHFIIPHYYTNQILVSSFVSENEFVKEHSVFFGMFSNINIENINWIGLENDSAYILEYFENNYNANLTDTYIINNIYETDFFNLLVYNFVNFPFLGIHISIMNILNLLPNNIYIFKTINILAVNNHIFIEYFKELEIWNLNNVDSILILVIPWTLIIFSFTASVFIFDWNIKMV